jgi:hypothetical protein
MGNPRRMCKLRNLIVCLILLSQAATAAPVKQSLAPMLLPGASIDAGQWRVKPIRARVTSEQSLPRVIKQSKTYLLVEVELTNLTEKSSRDFSFIVRIEQPALPPLGEPSILLVRDMDLPDRLHPGMPETLMLVWPWPEMAAVPPELRLTITGKTFKKADNLVGAPGWFNPKVVAVTNLPLSTR